MPQAKKDIDRPGSQRRRNGKFRGMVLERLGGRTLDVELAAPALWPAGRALHPGSAVPGYGAFGTQVGRVGVQGLLYLE